jgi:hypothetical protein
MRRVVLLVLVGCSREPAPPKPKPEPAPAPKEPGSYGDLVSSTQSGSATETRSELACTEKFVELSEQPRRDVKIVDKHCTQKNLEARFACYDKRRNMLDALPGVELWKQAEESELVDSVARRTFVAREAGATLSATERELVAAYMFDNEVRNGGVHQFFFNSSGDESLEARAGFARFGMTETLAMMDCALSAFPNNKPSKDRETRNNELARWGEKQFEIFSTLNGAYYVVGDEEWHHAYPYIRDHRAEFPNAGK